MLSPRVISLVAALSFTAGRSSELKVLSTSPEGAAAPWTPIQVIFDRPVAGSLDRTVDPAGLITITPHVAGRAEWRDPVTLRFIPAGPLMAGARYTIVIANQFSAMDGSRLAEPYQYGFTVTGPQLIGGGPVNEHSRPQYLTPDATFELIYSYRIDPGSLRGFAYLDFDQTCRQPSVIKLNVVGERSIKEADPWVYREAGGWERDRAGDSLRRVLELKPERPLPLGCRGDLVAPREVDPEGTSPFVRWAFATYGPFRLIAATCAGGKFCPTGGVSVTFSTPVRGSEVQRRLKLLPATEFAVSDTAAESPSWFLETTLRPHTAYAAVIDTAMRDVFEQAPTGNPAAGFKTTGYAANIEYEYGRLTVERAPYRTLAVRHVNVDTLEVSIAPIPASMLPAALKWNRWNSEDSTITVLMRRSATQRIGVSGERDRVRVYGVKLPAYNAARAGMPVLQAVRISSPSLSPQQNQAAPVALVQVTDLAVHARIGERDGAVWVTGVGDGRPRAGATVVLYDASGRSRARSRTNADGLATLTGIQPDTTTRDGWYGGFEGYVIVTLGNDRALASISTYDPDLSPWRFNVRSGWGNERLPIAAAVFTERGIYRPGETVHAKAIVRQGNLGNLMPPARGDSIRWVFQSRDGGSLGEATVGLSTFGTSDQTLTLQDGLPLGTYSVSIRQMRGGTWTDLATASYRVAEYRPPEFLVDLEADSTAHFPEDTVLARVEARYLFGAPMARAAVNWSARQASLDFWDLDIPNTAGYTLGETGWWWEDSEQPAATSVTAEGSDTLDGRGRLQIRFPLAATLKGRPARATIEVGVTDVNRQSVGARASVLVHPAGFYIGAKPLGTHYFWTAGTSQSVGVMAVRPNGERLAGVKVRGTIVRREWHQVHRTRGGYAEVYGEWVQDTVASCSLTTAVREDAVCTVTPPGGGTYIVTLTATDKAGRTATTSLYRWATGKDWVPWNDESQFKMDVVPDRTRYQVGDTATVLFASPFTDADAWLTVEREGLIEQRRLRLTSGSTTIKFPVTERWAPNAFVSILVARGRSAPPGPLDDPGRPTIRVGYAELRVTPEVKRLAVLVTPAQAEYRPGDTARVKLAVTDQAGRGRKSEVTLWAVDEGVLSLTGYRTPDPIDLLYAPRGLGLRLTSNLTTVAPQVPEGEKGGRAPGGGGGTGEADVLRSRFKTTAFFLGSVETDSAGRAVASARLPDNLTTFRVMAVAVTDGDRYGNGQSPLLVTRPLLARPALPRFVRQGDRFSAGVVVNQRAGGTPRVTVQAETRGADLVGEASRSTVLEAGRGSEVRFEFRQPGEGPGGAEDSVSFRFGVSGGGERDAVERKLMVKPSYRPRAWTVAGVLTDTATAEFALPDGLDRERSRLGISLGNSPLGMIKGLRQQLRVYPYYCTEQISSVVEPIIALYRAQQQLQGVTLQPGDPRREIEAAVSVLSRRQRTDGGIGLWGADGWTTPWLSAHAGTTLLEAKAAGVAVSDSVLARLGDYLRRSLTQTTLVRAPVIGWYDEFQVKLSDRVAAADFLSRLGRPEIPAENELLRTAAQLSWEDRMRLAEMLARRKAVKAATSLLAPAWAEVKVEGRKAAVPLAASGRYHYFPSRVRPAARLLVATLAVDSAHPLIGPLIETLVAQGRAGVWDPWNTQDYAAAVAALAAVDRRLRAGLERPFVVTAGGRTLFAGRGGATRPGGRDSTFAVAGILGSRPGETRLSLKLRAEGPGPSVYYFLTVTEVPLQRPVNPEDQGIRLERWYERYDASTPVASVGEGELVRVRLRITVPSDRNFVVVDDALPAGLEPVDLSLRTASLAPGPGGGQKVSYLAPEEAESEGEEGGGEAGGFRWYYGSWDSGWWSPFDHREIRDDRVVYSATVLWKGTYTMTYVARATTPGTFIRPPAHAEEMYNPAVYGRSDGGTFTVTAAR